MEEQTGQQPTGPMRAQLRRTIVQVSLELGRTELTLDELLELDHGSIIDPNRLAGEPIEVRIGEQLMARGEIVTVGEYFGIRVTEVLSRFPAGPMRADVGVPVGD